MTIEEIDIEGGGMYKGEVDEEGNMCGQGKCTFPNDDVYEGEWEDNNFHGYGKYYWPNGERYEGEYRDDERCGKGTLFTLTGQYRGEWREDNRHGFGIQEFKTGERYEGEWQGDVYHGRGVKKEQNGSLYEGEWFKGERQGRGANINADGDSYEGEWVKDKMCGRGTHKWRDGTVYQGMFKDGLKHGQGCERYKNGSWLAGNWIMGKHDNKQRMHYPQDATVESMKEEKEQLDVWDKMQQALEEQEVASPKAAKRKQEASSTVKSQTTPTSSAAEAKTSSEKKETEPKQEERSSKEVKKSTTPGAEPEAKKSETPPKEASAAEKTSGKKPETGSKAEESAGMKEAEKKATGKEAKETKKPETAEKPKESTGKSSKVEEKDSASSKPQTTAVVSQSSTLAPETTLVQTQSSAVDDGYEPLAFDDDELRQWERMRLLGKGSFGAVYEAGLPNGETVCVKVVELGSIKDDEEMKKVRDEITLMSRLNHRNIVQYYGCLEDNAANTLNIFMEYVTGGTLNQYIKRFKKVKYDTMRRWVKQLVQGVAYLHKENVVHRDIKGDNILVNINGTLKIADFGCSKSIDDVCSKTHGCSTMTGTPYWMAPEIIKSDATGYGTKADIWSIGCTIVEMMTGKPPWPEFSSMWAAVYHIANSTGLPTGIPSDLSPELTDLLDKCFERDPQKRISAEEMLLHPYFTKK